MSPFGSGMDASSASGTLASYMNQNGIKNLDTNDLYKTARLCACLAHPASKAANHASTAAELRSARSPILSTIYATTAHAISMRARDSRGGQ